MEFGPRHPHTFPPVTSPDRLPCGSAVRRPGLLSPPDHFPARAGPPPGHRQAHQLMEKPQLQLISYSQKIHIPSHLVVNQRTADIARSGFVANFAQKVMMG